MSKNNPPSTQEHLPIAGIQDSIVVMNDASVRAILKVEPINFELKSETEQNAIIYGYQSFLNSLDFPIQIVIQSKKLDLERYLHDMEKKQKLVTNELLRIQMEDYVDFLRRLISIANIMSKRFYISVSFSATGKGGASVNSLIHKAPSGPLFTQEEFDRYRGAANNRAATIASGLSRLGLKVTQLDTQQLIELFYSIYNPDIAAEERLTDVETMNSGFISSQNPLGNVATDQSSDKPKDQTPESSPKEASKTPIQDTQNATSPTNPKQ